MMWCWAWALLFLYVLLYLWIEFAHLTPLTFSCLWDFINSKAFSCLLMTANKTGACSEANETLSYLHASYNVEAYFVYFLLRTVRVMSRISVSNICYSYSFLMCDLHFVLLWEKLQFINIMSIIGINLFLFFEYHTCTWIHIKK